MKIVLSAASAHLQRWEWPLVPPCWGWCTNTNYYSSPGACSAEHRVPDMPHDISEGGEAEALSSQAGVADLPLWGLLWGGAAEAWGTLAALGRQLSPRPHNSWTEGGTHCWGRCSSFCSSPPLGKALRRLLASVASSCTPWRQEAELGGPWGMSPTLGCCMWHLCSHPFSLVCPAFTCI